jgi:hypothetical protein
MRKWGGFLRVLAALLQQREDLFDDRGYSFREPLSKSNECRRDFAKLYRWNALNFRFRN